MWMVHCLQRAMWGMDQGLEIPCEGQTFRDTVETALETMTKLSPERAIMLLCPIPNDQEGTLQEEAEEAELNLRGLDTEEAATMLLENLYYNLRRITPDLRITPAPEYD